MTRSPATRDEVVGLFGDLTTLPKLVRLLQHGREVETAWFTLELSDGLSVRVPNVDILFSRAKMAKLLAVTVDHTVLPGEQKEWFAMMVNLTRYAKDVEEDLDERLSGAVEDWIDRYADQAAIADQDHAVPHRQPFHDQTGRLHVSADTLARWIRREVTEQITRPALRQALHDLGWEAVRIQYNTRGSGHTRSRTSARYHRAPITRGSP